MKFTFCSLLLLLCINTGSAQVSPKVKKFLDDVIVNKNVNYWDSAGHEAAGYITDALNHGSVFHRFARDLNEPNSSREKADVPLATLNKTPYGWVMLDSLLLTAKEIAYVRNEAAQMKKFKWDANLFAEAKVVSADSINIIEKERTRRWKEKDYTDRSMIYSWVSFSKPIFLRNNTYCLFYFSDHYTSSNEGGGGGHLAVYKKEKGKWVYWCFVTTWVT